MTRTTPLIQDLQVTSRSIRVVADRELTATYLRDDFVAEYDPGLSEAAQAPTVAALPFLLNVLPIVWLTGRSYHVDELDADLAGTMHEVREGFRAMYPRLSWNGELTYDRVVARPRNDADGFGVMFSGGLDSVYSSITRRGARQVLVSIWGNDVRLHNQRGWDEVRRAVEAYAGQYGFENAYVRSNLRLFIDTEKVQRLSRGVRWWVRIQHGIAISGLAIPALVSAGCGTLLVGSSHTPSFSEPWGSSPTLEGRMVAAGIRVVHDGYECTRQDKLRSVLASTVDGERPLLRVCYVRPDGEAWKNCCVCEKCLRTATGLLIEGGALRDFGFDLSPDQLAERVRAGYENRRFASDANVAFMWGVIQQRVRQRFFDPGAEPLPADMEAYFRWLATFDFERYRIRYQRGRSLVEGARQALKAVPGSRKAAAVFRRIAYGVRPRPSVTGPGGG